MEGMLRVASSLPGTFIERVTTARLRARPTGLRQFILEVPNVRWNDIGGNDDLKLEIQQVF